MPELDRLGFFWEVLRRQSTSRNSLATCDGLKSAPVLSLPILNRDCEDLAESDFSWDVPVGVVIPDRVPANIVSSSSSSRFMTCSVFLRLPDVGVPVR